MKYFTIKRKSSPIHTVNTIILLRAIHFLQKLNLDPFDRTKKKGEV